MLLVSGSHGDISSSDRLGGVLVQEHAVGRRHHVLAGHQGAPAELIAVAHEGRHPGVFVFLGSQTQGV